MPYFIYSHNTPPYVDKIVWGEEGRVLVQFIRNYEEIYLVTYFAVLFSADDAFTGSGHFQGKL